MRLLITNHIANAYESLRSNRTRTNLTILGVTIGIASIVIILSLSAGATRIIANQVQQLGGNIAVIRPGSPDRDVELKNLTSSLAGASIASSLTEQDVNDIRNIPNVSSVAPLMFLGGSAAANSGSSKNASIVATSPDLTKVSGIALADGQFIDSVTNRDTAVVGNQLAIDLFGTDQAIGQTFKTHGQEFTVIGVLKAVGNPINYNNVDFDHAAIISLESGKAMNQGVASISQINVQAASSNNLAAIIKQSDNILTTNHHDEKDYEILSGNDLSRPANELFYTIAATLTAVAAISLVVGGIGIMNIMLVGVSERTREIGIRKALGASNSHITWQFLIESLAMSLAGGILGYIIGYVLAFAVSRTFLTFDPVFTWQIATVSLGVSLVIGLIFGLYPAIRAARKDPIEALRQYH